MEVNKVNDGVTPDELYDAAMDHIMEAIKLFAILIAEPDHNYIRENLGCIVYKLSKIVDD